MILKATEFIKSRFNGDIGYGIYLSVNNDNYSFKTKPECYGVISEFLKVNAPNIYETAVGNVIYNGV